MCYTPFRVMWQSRRAAQSTQSQNEKTESKELVLQVHERPIHEAIFIYIYTVWVVQMLGKSPNGFIGCEAAWTRRRCYQRVGDPHDSSADCV